MISVHPVTGEPVDRLARPVTGTRSLPAVPGAGDSENGLDVRDRLPSLRRVGAELPVAVRLDESLPEVAASHLVVGVLQCPLQVLGVLAATLLQTALSGGVLGLALAEYRLDVLVGGVGRRGAVDRQRGQVGLRGLIVGVLGCPVLQAGGLVFASLLARRVLTSALLRQTNLACGRVLRRHALADLDVRRTASETREKQHPCGCNYNCFFHWNLFLAAI